MGKVVMYSTVSVDGFIAHENDQPGPLFHWLSSGDVPLDETGQLTVSQASYDHTRAYWDQIAVTIAGRHVFDLTDGWDGTPPSGRPRLAKLRTPQHGAVCAPRRTDCRRTRRGGRPPAAPRPPDPRHPPPSP